jgi:hypothetical protein
MRDNLKMHFRGSSNAIATDISSVVDENVETPEEIEARENQELIDYLNKHPLIKRGGIKTDNWAYRKMTEALEEFHKERGFDMLIVDTYDVVHNPKTLVMQLEQRKVKTGRKRGEVGIVYQVIPYHFSVKCNMDALGAMLCEKKVGDEINHVRRGNTLFTSSEYVKLNDLVLQPKQITESTYKKQA